MQSPKLKYHPLPDCTSVYVCVCVSWLAIPQQTSVENADHRLHICIFANHPPVIDPESLPVLASTSAAEGPVDGWNPMESSFRANKSPPFQEGAAGPKLGSVRRTSVDEASELKGRLSVAHTCVQSYVY